jgi:hypothetical protein
VRIYRKAAYSYEKLEIPTPISKTAIKLFRFSPYYEMQVLNLLISFFSGGLEREIDKELVTLHH